MKYLFILLFFFIINNAGAEELKTDSNFSAFVNNLQTADVDFVQTKNIPNINRSFISTGKIKFVKEKGFIWQQLEPKEYKFISTKDHYRTGDTDNSLSELPHYSDLAELIDDIFNNDFSMLNSAFSIKYSESDENWFLLLIPEVDKIGDIFRQISINGNIFQINEIKFEYRNRSVVTISFSPSKVILKDEIEY